MKNFASFPIKPHQRLREPTLTAQSTLVSEEYHETIAIQALASHPDLLPLRPGSKAKPHEDHCECDACEEGEGLQELDF
jgi:hypothetical protein